MSNNCKVSFVYPVVSEKERADILSDIERVASEIVWGMEEEDDELLDVDVS